MVEAARAARAEVEESDRIRVAFVGRPNAGKSSLVNRILGEERMLVGNPAQYTMRADDPRVLTGQAHRAYVKIAEGCNRSCSFCAIPSFRGKQRSRTIEDLVREAGRLAAAGVVELNLISQDTIAYGRDLGTQQSLAELLTALADVDGIHWVRTHYLYPETLTDPLIDVLSGHDKVLPYIDMPLQHASDAMLRAMRRGHGGERMYKVVERLRRAITDMVFRSTFIVGHPGETAEDFDELRKFVQLPTAFPADHEPLADPPPAL